MGLRILILFGDNEGALIKQEFQTWMALEGIKHDTIQAYSPKQNGPAENAIKQIIQKALSLMWAPRIPVGFWLEACRLAAYLKNRSPHKAIGCIPFEMYYGKKPDLGYLRIFGCRVYVHLEEEHRKKWDSRTVEAVFFGYYSTAGLYLIYDINKQVMMKKRDVTFHENILGHPAIDQWGILPEYNILEVSVELVDDVPDLVKSGDERGKIQRIEELRLDKDALLNMTLAGLKMREEKMSKEDDIDMAVIAIISEKVMGYVREALEECKKRKSEGYKLFVLDHEVKRKCDQEDDELYERLGKIEEEHSSEGLEKRYDEAYEKLKKEYMVKDIELDLENAVEESTPTSWKQVIKSKNRAFWLKTYCDEMCVIARMGVFIITRDIPVRKRPLLAKWVFSTKKDVQTGKILKFKVR